MGHRPYRTRNRRKELVGGELHKAPEQLLLNWPVNEKFAKASFLPALSNEKAVKWIDRWPDWLRGDESFHCLIIYGPEGCGKTHLSHVWQDISKARKIDAVALLNTDFMSGDDFVFIIEDVDKHIADFEIQKKLFHLYNWTKEQGGYVLLTAKERPKNWPLSLKDLSSRLLASETIEIKAPDDELLKAIIIKQFSDRQIIVSDEVINYLIPRIDRSFDAIRKIVQNIDQLSFAEKKKITIPVVRRALDTESKD